MDAFTDILRFSAGQGYVAARWQAAEIGIAPRAFDEAVRQAGCQRLYPGVWLLPGADLNGLARVHAARLGVSEPHLITGHAALWLCRVVATEPKTVDVLVPNGTVVTGPRWIVTCQAREFDRIAGRRISGVRTTNVPRSIVDYARDHGLNEVVTVIASAARLRRCDPADVAAEIDRRARFPGRAAARRAVSLLTDELSHSGEERYARRLISAAALGFHPRPYPVVVGGRIIAEVDIARPDLRYGVEIDGPPHLLPEQAAKDRERDRRLLQHDWVVDRFLWTQIRSNPKQFVDDVRAAVAARVRNLQSRAA